MAYCVARGSNRPGERHGSMRDVVPVSNPHRRDRKLTLAFVSAVGSTIPLFNIYRSDEGFTNADISLPVLGRLSNHVGPHRHAVHRLRRT